MVSSRDRKIRQRLFDEPKGSSPERRRLRFSFQINDVKDRGRPGSGPEDPAVYARRRRGGAYLVATLEAVNRPFPAFLPAPGTPGVGRKNRCGPPRGFPHSPNESIEEAEVIQLDPEDQEAIKVCGPDLRSRRYGPYSLPGQGALPKSFTKPRSCRNQPARRGAVK